MKYLDYPELESLSRALTFESAECKVFTRIESYSCKAVKKERQLFKHLESQYATGDHLDESLASPFGRLDHSSARKTLFLLIATLNGAFPDHDFTDVNPADFKRETNSDSVLSSLGTTLLSLRSNSNAPRSFSSFPSSYDAKDMGHQSSSMAFSPNNNGTTSINHPQLASVLDDIMCIADCEVYSFHPDAESDPHACADPEEEGDDMTLDRFADDEDEVWSNDEDPSTTMSTPRRIDDSALDAPMFDEELIGNGFAPSGSQSTSSHPTTPRTPTSTRSRPFSARKRSSPIKASTASTSLGGSSSSYSEDDDDIDGGLNGLLWATYAFFYNRKLKRILFVSVWSRRNGVGPSYSFSPPSYPSMAYSHPLLHNFVLDDGDQSAIESTSAPSPAKRAISKSTAKSRKRSLSSSPAPSALSPFPHTQANSKLNPLVQPIQSMSIASALKQSSSAPAATIRVPSSSNAKRTNMDAPREQTRKQRKVSDTKGPGNPLAA